MNQKELFKKKWDQTKEKQCQVCGRGILSPLAINFAHILGKGAYPAFKFLLENIWLLCGTCHHEWDFGNKQLPKFEQLRQKEQELKERYHSMPHKFLR